MKKKRLLLSLIIALLFSTMACGNVVMGETDYSTSADYDIEGIGFGEEAGGMLPAQQIPYLISSIVLLVVILGLLILFILRNKEDRKKLERIVRERTAESEAARERLQLAMNISKAGVWEMSVADKTMSFDEGFGTLMRIPWPSPISLMQWADHISEFMDQDEYKEFFDYLRYHFDGTVESDFTALRYEFPDGTVKYTNNTSKIIYDKKGKPERVVGMAWEVTEEIREQEKYAKVKEKELRIQEFISKFALPFTQPYDFDELMSNALHDLREFLEMDRACIYIFREDRTLICHYEDIGNEVIPSVSKRIYPYEEMRPMYDVIEKVPYYYKNDTAEFYERFPIVSLGAKSFCYVPIMLDGSRAGYLVFSRMFEAADWVGDEFRLAAMASSIIAGAFAMNKSDKALKAATAEAQRATMAKSQFVSNMSHEIRTPINAIVGMAQIADRTDNPDKIKACLKSIQSSSKQLLSIINDVLDISKIESGKIELSEDYFTLERVIAKAHSMVVTKADSMRQNITVRMGDKLRIRYFGDEVRLAQIITNLLSNAVKFTQVGGNIAISAQQAGEEDDKAILEISVKDNGIGMEKEQMERIFHSFVQADNSISRRFGGTGLGLTICKNLAEQMGGTISVDSKTGEGSEFIIRIKLAYSEQDEIEAKQAVRSRLNDKRILLISDDQQVIEVCVGFFSKYGAAINVCHDSWAGVQSILRVHEIKQPYDIIFFDNTLSSEETNNSYKLIKDIVKRDSIVYITEFGEWSQIQDGLMKGGITRNLNKPLFVTAIYDIVCDITGGCLQESEEEYKFDFSKIHILVAEDIEINREILSEMLAETGAQIDFADNGRLAVEMYSRNFRRYNAIIMDIQMPEMNGLAATRAIRQMEMPEAKSIPIIAMTANAFKEDVDECLAAGMNDHIAKPIDIKKLMEKIQTAVFPLNIF